MTFRILVVCVANVCRSPLAGALLSQAIEDAELGGLVVVDTAGVSATEGDRPCPAILEQARPGTAVERRLDLHSARQVTREDIERAALVLTADRAVRAEVVRTAPRHQAKVFTMRQVTELARVDGVRTDDHMLSDLARTPVDALQQWSLGLGMARGLGTPQPAKGWRGRESWRVRQVHEHDIPDAHLGGRHSVTNRFLIEAVADVTGFFASVREPA